MPRMLSIGSDMEVFAMDGQGNHVAICGLIGGSKEAPLRLGDIGEGFMLQEDNVALEFNIPVCTTNREFRNSFRIMRDTVRETLAKHSLLPSNECAISFDKAQLYHPQALIFGCEPDYSAWSMKENEKPHCSDETLRTAGGHIHVGCEEEMVEGVKRMDLFLGVPSVLLDNSAGASRRRELYGKAGAMRPKEYGWEYRVLSNFWMFNDRLVHWVFANTKKACESPKNISKESEEDIQRAINTGDKELAAQIVKGFGIPMP